MTRLHSPTLLHIALIIQVAIYARTEEPPMYKICKGENIECTSVIYGAEDASKGSNCREKCREQSGDLTQKTTAYFCEGSDKPCTAYDVFGRKGYSKNYDRHVMCVQACQLVERTNTQEKSTYEICRGEHTDCTSVLYSSGDASKGSSCRKGCAEQQGDLTEKTTAYFCEGSDKPCTAYDVFGRKGYGKNYDRHVMCVQGCQLVERVENSADTSFQVCRDVRKKCLQINKREGTFSDYRKCVSVCNGWEKLVSKNEHTAYICPESADCQAVTYFTTPGGTAFRRLKDCLEVCMMVDVSTVPSAYDNMAEVY
nr:unnamed protein product [Spirometra erinaceieuropaei]